MQSKQRREELADLICIAAVGAGVNATAHMRTASQNENSRLVAVMDVDAERARAAGEEHGVRTNTDLDALLAGPEANAVSICTPNQCEFSTGC